MLIIDSNLQTNNEPTQSFSIIESLSPEANKGKEKPEEETVASVKKTEKKEMKKAAVESVVLIMEDDDPKSLEQIQKEALKKEREGKKEDSEEKKKPAERREREKSEDKATAAPLDTLPTEGAKSTDKSPSAEDTPAQTPVKEEAAVITLENKEQKEEEEDVQFDKEVDEGIKEEKDLSSEKEEEDITKINKLKMSGSVWAGFEGITWEDNHQKPHDLKKRKSASAKKREKKAKKRKEKSHIQQPIDQTSPHLVTSGTALPEATMGKQPASQLVQPVSLGGPAQSVPGSVHTQGQQYSQSGGDSIISVSQSQPGLVMSSSTSSTITPPRYVYKTGPLEEPKRRFTKEKQEDKGLLGYEHGPQHQTNLMVQPGQPQQPQPPTSQQQQQQMMHVVQDAAQQQPQQQQQLMIIQPQPTELQQPQRQQLMFSQVVQQKAGLPQQQPQQNTNLVEGDAQSQVQTTVQLLMPPPPPPGELIPEIKMLEMLAGVLLSATSVLKRAVELDTAGKYADAVVCYQLILDVLKGTPAEKRDGIHTKMNKYMKRVEELKKKVEEEKEAEKCHEQIRIEDDSTGHSLERLFGRCLHKTFTEVTVEDPYIRSKQQIYNFSRFCKMIKSSAKAKKIKIWLITGQNKGEDQQRNQQKKLSELATSLLSEQILLQIEYSQTLHNREIRFNNGWIVKIDRGLDIYKPIQGKVGFCDFDRRKCKETTIDYIYSKDVINSFSASKS